MKRQSIQLDIEYKRIVQSTRKALRQIKQMDPTASVIIGHSVIPLFQPATKTYRIQDPKEPAQWVVYIYGRASKYGDRDRRHVRYFHAMYSEIENIMWAMCN